MASDKRPHWERQRVRGGAFGTPWSEKEEKALIDAVKHVEGPHWAQIHQLSGEGGSINDTLKGRSDWAMMAKSKNLARKMRASGEPMPPFFAALGLRTIPKKRQRGTQHHVRSKYTKDNDLD
jgi:hypothetical protein